LRKRKGGRVFSCWCVPQKVKPQGWRAPEHHTTFGSRAVELPRLFPLLSDNALQPTAAMPTSSQKQVSMESEICSQHLERMISLSFSSPHVHTQIPQCLISGGNKLLNLKCTQLMDSFGAQLYSHLRSNIMGE